ncbi:hypothetical protein [Pararoseomonas baculiformis]|uniref:hypothetical protein n=1 Tax=Pararoseomonas baculiformis TaxID=2820812 RepID=UPI001AE0D6A8|nr:hypothetical protein [Pararoseomonas baculiformis]
MLSSVAEEVRAHAVLLPQEVAADIVKRAQTKRLLSGRPEVQNVVAALLAYATQGLDTLRSARSRIRKIVGYAIAKDVTIADLTKQHGGFWAIYGAASGGGEVTPSAAGRRVTVFLSQELEDRAAAQRSVIQLVPNAGRYEAREVLLITGVDGPSSLPAGSPLLAGPAAGCVGTEPQLDAHCGGGNDTSDPTGRVDLVAPGAADRGAGWEAIATGRSNGEPPDGSAAMPEGSLDDSAARPEVDLLTAAGEGALADGIDSAEDPSEAVRARFLGRRFIVGPLMAHPEQFAELERCAEGERLRLRGSTRSRLVWTAHTITPLLARVIQQHGARLVRDDELGAAG